MARFIYLFLTLLVAWILYAFSIYFQLEKWICSYGNLSWVRKLKTGKKFLSQLENLRTDGVVEPARG